MRNFPQYYNVVIYGGYELTLEEFILEYYLELKRDNLLRQFVLIHLDKLVVRLTDIIRTQLFKHMDDFKFQDIDEVKKINKLNNDLAERETELLNINPEKIAEDNTAEIETQDNVTSMREEILNDLKQNNPDLEKY